MKRLPALLLALLLPFALVACGGDGDTSAEDPSFPTGEASSTPEPDPDPNGEVDFTLVALLAESNAGGTVHEEAVALDSELAVEEFAGQFNGRTLHHDIREAVAEADLGEGEALYAAVVDVSCEMPTGVEVERTDTALLIRPTGMPKSEIMCFVPVTSVAIIAVPAP